MVFKNGFKQNQSVSCEHAYFSLFESLFLEIKKKKKSSVLKQPLLYLNHVWLITVGLFEVLC